MSASRRRIAILGGGVAGLTAAYELTNAADWQERYEITVYQLGWRLGGKCATGRGPSERIEEHGIHIMQGWYHNGFRMFSEIYDERRRRGLAPDSPYPTFESALEPDNGTLLTEFSPASRSWSAYPINFPANDAPHEGGPLSTWQNLLKLASLGAEASAGLVARDRRSRLNRAHRALLERGRVERWLEALTKALSATGELDASAFRRFLPIYDGLVRALALLVRVTLGKDPDPSSNLVRALTLAEMTATIMRGLLADVYDERADAFDFHRINDLDYRAWLRKHGASARVLANPVVRFNYTGMFANLADGEGRGGLVSAGSTLRVILLAAGYRGGFVYKFRAGTGDTLIMPLYEVLAARGVRFEFFHEIEHLEPQGAHIEAIRVAEQVTLKERPYRPGKNVGGVHAWPNAPLWAQIDDAQAEQLQRDEVDLESPWSGWTPAARRTLRRGEDFDEVVLAIPIKPLETICGELVRRDDRWRAMLANIRTVQTPCVQLWLDKSLEELGMDSAEWGLRPGSAPQTVVYADPLYSWIEMTSIMERHEAWPAERRPRALVYYTGALEDAEPPPPASDLGFPAREQARVTEMTKAWLDHNMGFFWPKAHARGTGAFDLSVLHDPAGEAAPSGRQRLTRQLIRHNAEPSARYTLAVPGSERFRLAADESGYDNLFLAGDWTNFGVNVGYVEGTIVSGIRAAAALRRSLGLPHDREIYEDAPFQRFGPSTAR